MRFFRKTCNLISGILFAICLAHSITQYSTSGSYEQTPLVLLVLFGIIYLMTCRDTRYRLLPFWKRFLRIILLPVVLFSGAIAIFSILQFVNGPSLGVIPTTEAALSPSRTAVIAVICLIVLASFYFYLFNPIANVSARKLGQMEGHEFETYCAKVLKKNGYKSIRVTQGSSDYGADIIAKKHGRKWVVQCKRYSTVVGSTPVQEISAAMQYYNAKKAAVITNSTFTANAKRLAKANGILLIDGEALSKMSKRL